MAEGKFLSYFATTFSVLLNISVICAIVIICLKLAERGICL